MSLTVVTAGFTLAGSDAEEGASEAEDAQHAATRAEVAGRLDKMAATLGHRFESLTVSQAKARYQAMTKDTKPYTSFQGALEIDSLRLPVKVQKKVSTSAPQTFKSVSKQARLSPHRPRAPPPVAHAVGLP